MDFLTWNDLSLDGRLDGGEALFIEQPLNINFGFDTDLRPVGFPALPVPIKDTFQAPNPGRYFNHWAI